MAITDPNSVLILGAGVSAPFQLPLGGAMITDLSKMIGAEVGQLYSEEDFMGGQLTQKLRTSANTVHNFKRFPFHGTIARLHWSEDEGGFDVANLNTDLEKIRKLKELLDNQTSETIDDFIVENPSYAFLTKIGIGVSFVLSCYSFEQRTLSPKPFASRNYPPSSNNRNWVHLLINIVRQGIRENSVGPDNKIKIITFNYDKILEYILETQFSNTEAPYSHYTDYVEIIHVHGECGDLSATSNGLPADVCIKWAKGIHVINEQDVPTDVTEKRLLAKSIIQSAEELFFCGFSFSGPNCRLLGLGTPNKYVVKRLISVCNYDGNVGISKSVRRFEFQRDPTLVHHANLVETEIEEAAGTTEKPLSVLDWLRLGYLGELPG
ncbi:hypothetical protein MNBD_ALPHA04-2129 [hydrothermal vent metagenome]|uniref:SIR2-like domain-containing protein n=1 Tax=hydrothermal vent metagenome TaxID=652676 RepID=A0A3B0SEN3_9ZZZZ